jgi:HSP20 family molecular chaperone IbpA
VHHVGICDDNSVAGERYNKDSFKLLVDMLEHRNSLGTPVDLLACVQQELQRLLPLFVNVEPTVGGAESQQMTVQWSPLDKAVVKGELAHLGDFEIKTKAPEQKLMMKIRAGTAMSAVTEHDASFRPQVNIFDQTLDRVNDRRIIQIDCPGVCSENVTITARPNGVKICIEKRALIDENNVKPVEDILQHHGRFEKEFIFEQETNRFDICDTYGWYLEDGILTVVLKQELDRTIGMAGRAPPTAISHDA